RTRGAWELSFVKRVNAARKRAVRDKSSPHALKRRVFEASTTKHLAEILADRNRHHLVIPTRERSEAGGICCSSPLPSSKWNSFTGRPRLKVVPFPLCLQN